MTAGEFWLWFDEAKLGDEVPDEARKYAATDITAAWQLAMYVLGGPFPEGEKLFATDSAKALDYARMILKGPFPAGEKVIAKNAFTAVQYAIVIDGRFPAAEKEIAKYPASSSLYAIHALGSRFKLGEKAIKKSPTLWKEYLKEFADEIARDELGEKLPTIKAKVLKKYPELKGMWESDFRAVVNYLHDEKRDPIARIAYEILCEGEAEEPLGQLQLGQPFIPYTYGSGRRAGNMLGPGDGSYCGAQIEGTMQYGFLPCSTPGLEAAYGDHPQSSASTGRLFGKSLQTLKKWEDQAIKFKLLEAPKCESADDAWELITRSRTWRRRTPADGWPEHDASTAVSAAVSRSFLKGTRRCWF